MKKLLLLSLLMVSGFVSASQGMTVKEYSDEVDKEYAKVLNLKQVAKNLNVDTDPGIKHLFDGFDRWKSDVDAYSNREKGDTAAEDSKIASTKCFKMSRYVLESIIDDLRMQNKDTKKDEATFGSGFGGLKGAFGKKPKNK